VDGGVVRGGVSLPLSVMGDGTSSTTEDSSSTWLQSETADRPNDAMRSHSLLVGVAFNGDWTQFGEGMSPVTGDDVLPVDEI
jgi:hypothetical protein